jgi:tetratricopeptide (TPR) repeat protein
MSAGRRFPVFPLLIPFSLVVAVGCGPEDPRPAGEEHAHAGHGVGSVSFPTSCSEEAQPTFERAVASLHSFWFPEADAGFREAAEIDPGCAMAHWGRAMTLWGNPMTRAAPPDARTEEALDVVARARTLAAEATPRERAYVEAVAALYEGHPEVGHLQRMRAHEEAMRELMEAHPDDPEAAIFYGRIVVGNAPPDDLTFSRQLHAAEIMEPLFREQPEHPGLAHYLIHAYDAPPIAEEGLSAAFRYADIAPDAPHALHMPTHIFTRMGYWEESIELNARSAQAEPDPDAAVHPMDYMVYAYLQLGRDREAGEVVARARDIPDTFYGGLLGYNFAAMQARYALERDRWAEAAALPLPVDAPPYVEAVTRFARGLGAARSGEVGIARAEIAALAGLRDRLRSEGEDYWATVVEAQRLASAAWVAHAEGDSPEALRLARAAADLEGTVEKHPVTPGPLLPATELLGDLLMELDRPGEARRAYEATLEQERNRARALFGAARAAEKAGEREAADRHYGALLDLLRDADEDRPDLQAARAWGR